MEVSRVDWVHTLKESLILLLEIEYPFLLVNKQMELVTEIVMQVEVAVAHAPAMVRVHRV